MFNQSPTTNLACPNCLNSLKRTKSRLQCNYCHRSFSVIQNEIPVLLKKNKSIDVTISEQQWDKQYRVHSVDESLKKDPMIVSHTKFLSAFQKNIKNGIFLDLGCGIAFQSLQLARKGVPTIGIDISIEGLVKSVLLFKREKLSGLFIQADFLHIPLKASSVRFIYWGLAIEYVRETQQAVNEAYRVLEKGGRVVAPFPAFSFTTLIYHQLRGGDIPRVFGLRQLFEFVHVRLLKGKYMHYGYGQTFTIGSMKKYFQNAGFKNIKIGYYDTYYPLALLPSFLRSLGWKIIRYRPFWPFAYIEATK